MDCPLCGGKESRVVDSKLREKGREIYRRRECEGCGGRFNTIESAELMIKDRVVISADGEAKKFAPEKLALSISEAFKGTQTELELKKISRRVVETLLSLKFPKREIPDSAIVETTTSVLAKIDPIAAFRYEIKYSGDPEVVVNKWLGLIRAGNERKG